MAKDLKENKDLTKEKDSDRQTEQILLTEEEFAKRERQKVKERINRVTRVAGLFAILILVYAGILDPLFELSFFGWMADKSTFAEGWSSLAELRIYDDPLQFGTWMGQLGVTVLLIGVIVLLVYFITYCIVDLINLLKTLVAAGRDITRDLSGNVRDTLPEDALKKKKDGKKKSLFSGSDVSEEELVGKPKKQKRRKESDSGLAGLSSEDLDKLLSGKNIDELDSLKETETNEEADKGTNSLF